MSLGYGVGDIITVTSFAWKVWKSCKDAPESFGNISTEVLSLHAVLKETEECVVLQKLTEERQSRLKSVCEGCELVLKDLENLVTRYKSLGTQSKRTWDRLKWGTEDINQLRARIISNTLFLTAWISISQTNVERKLEEFLQDYRRGNCAKSVISTSSIQSIVSREAEVWNKIRNELEDIGITVDAFEENKQFIFDWLVQALTGEGQEEQEGSSGQHAIGSAVNEPRLPNPCTEAYPPSISDGSSAPSSLFTVDSTADTSTSVTSSQPSSGKATLSHASSSSSSLPPLPPFSSLPPLENEPFSRSILSGLRLPNTRLSSALRKGDLPAVVRVVTDTSFIRWIKPELFQESLELAFEQGDGIAFRSLLCSGAHIIRDGKINLRRVLLRSQQPGVEALLKFLTTEPMLLKHLCPLHELLLTARQEGRMDILKLFFRHAVELGPKAMEELLYDHTDLPDADIFDLFLERGVDGVKDEEMIKVALVAAEQLGRDHIIVQYAEKCSTLKTACCLEVILAFFVRKKHRESAQTVLERGIVDINAWNPRSGRTVFQDAIRTGDLSLVKLFLDHGADVGSWDRSTGWSVLTEAAYHGYSDVVDILLEKGAEPNSSSFTGPRSPLWQAIQHNHRDIIHNLIERCKDDGLDDGSLSLATSSGDEGLVQLLLENGANPNFFRKDGGVPAILIAAKGGYQSIARLLLEKGAQPNIRHFGFGPTAINLAAKSGRLDIVQMLLEYGATAHTLAADRFHGFDPVTACASVATKEKSEPGTTHLLYPLMLAAAGGHLAVLQELLHVGADVNETCTRGVSAVAYACQAGHTDILNVLIKAGGRIPSGVLEAASASGLVEIVRTLLESGYQRVNRALSAACKSGHYEVARLLVENSSLKVDEYVDTRLDPSQGYKTALQWTCEKGYVKLARYLLEKGANPDRRSRDSSYGAPIELAALNGHDQIVWLLMEHGAYVPDDLRDRVTNVGHSHVAKLLQLRSVQSR